MKRVIALILIFALLLCGCDFQQTADAAFQKVLEKIASNQELQTWLEEHPIEELGANAKETLVKKFPVLNDLLNFDNLKQLMKTTGLDLMNQYINSKTPETREKAETLGAIIQILYPDLTDEVEAVLGN